MFNLEGKIGGDSDLSPQGQLFAQRLPETIQKQIGVQNLVIWTSTLKRYLGDN
jgi:6-phosphofructo-2-kinase/fructose-2,6-biphosphatase 2